MLARTNKQERVLILHGWGGSDAPHWQAELASEIAKNYGTVSFPLLSSCHFPSKNKWLEEVRVLLEQFRPTTVVCHSLANTLWFWLCEEGISEVERLFMVAPPSLETSEKTIKSFFPAPLPKSLRAKKVHMIASTNDPWVTVEEAKNLALHYNVSFEVLEDAGHINADSGYGKWTHIEKLVMEGL